MVSAGGRGTQWLWDRFSWYDTDQGEMEGLTLASFLLNTLFLSPEEVEEKDSFPVQTSTVYLLSVYLLNVYFGQALLWPLEYHRK